MDRDTDPELWQLNPQPGDTVLEIGSGTGYNAALLSEIVGDPDASSPSK